MKIGTALALLPLCGLPGCGAAPNATCTDEAVLSVRPATAIVSSSATPPGNQVQFTAGISFVASAPGCAVPAIALQAFPTWTDPDPIHISISSASDNTNGTALCKGPTAGPITLTASTTYNSIPPQQLTATVQLTCN